jgi:ABC-2 type transport system ATP-binding protein
LIYGLTVTKGLTNFSFYPNNHLLRFNMLKAKEITKSYGKKQIIFPFSLDLNPGSIIGFLGPNGAGKTTIIRMLNLITKPDSGNVMYDDKNIQESDLINIGYMPEEKGLYPNMNVWDQLIYFGRLRGLSKKMATDRVKMWLEKFKLTEFKFTKHSALSKGNAQKVQFIQTVLHDPKILILDEPLSGLDPINSELINQTILELKNKGKSIIFSTHRMEQVEELCDHIIMINKGKIVLQGDLNDLRKQGKNNVLELELVEEFNSNDFIISGLEIKQITNFKIQVILNESQNVNQVIRFCIAKNIALSSFKILLPSVRELFINAIS